MEKGRNNALGPAILAVVALVLGILIGFFLGRTSAVPQVQDLAATQTPSAQSQAVSSQPQAQPSSADVVSSSDKSAFQEQAPSPDQASTPVQGDGASQAGASQTSAGQSQDGSSASQGQSSASDVQVVEDGRYTSKDEVAAYIHGFGHLPSNYISKSKAKKAGWVSSKGNLDEVLPGMSIGGSEFYNDEGLLPDAAGRTWTECDINYEGGYRGAERIVFSNDGLIFYTDDHYESFEQLY